MSSRLMSLLNDFCYQFTNVKIQEHYNQIKQQTIRGYDRHEDTKDLTNRCNSLAC